MRFSIALAVLWLAGLPAVLSAAPLDGLYVYLQYQVISRNFRPDHYMFLPDGRYLNAAPPGEISRAAFESACAAKPRDCGTYQLSGTTLTLNPNGGKSWTTTFKQTGPDKYDMFGAEGSKVTRKFPAGTKLNGRYSATGGYGNIVSARAYDFHPDGTFSYEAVGSVRSPGMGSAVSQNQQTGTYRLSGNTLELTINGQTKRLLAYDLGDPANLLMIDGESYARRK